VKPVELVQGYGVYLTQKQIDAALDGSKNNPTKLIRNLIGAFFKPEVLAASSACGTRKHKALDADVLQACIRKSTKISQQPIMLTPVQSLQVLYKANTMWPDRFSLTVWTTSAQTIGENQIDYLDS